MEELIPIVLFGGLFGTIITVVLAKARNKRAEMELEQKRLEVRERELNLDEQKIRFLQQEDDRLLKDSKQPETTEQQR